MTKRSTVCAVAVALFVTGCAPPGGRVRTLGEAGASHRLVDHARALRNAPYQLNGRDTQNLPGIDCEGLVFVAFEGAYRVPWRKHSVDPTRFVAGGTLGSLVEDLRCKPYHEIDYSKLQPGDIILVLRFEENEKEPALCKLRGRDAWVWHMGVYVGETEHLFIHADPFHGEVVEVPLEKYLASFWLANEGVSVIRTPQYTEEQRAD